MNIFLFNSIFKGYFLILFFLCLCTHFSIFAQNNQPNVTTFEEKKGDEIKIFAKNTYPCEMSVMLEFPTTENVCGTNENTIILKPNVQKQLLCTLTPCKKNQKWRYSYKFFFYTGNILNKKYDKDFVYELPYSKGESYKVMQGYFGDFSHQEQHAIDFDMPIGTKVCAMREGVVIRLREDSNIGGKDRKFIEDCNFVWIMHNDGSIANYVHFKQNGVAVNVGDKVKKGQVIAYSGNTGFSSSPHLHIDIGLPTKGKRMSFATDFYLSNGKIGQLKKGDNHKK